MLSDTDDATQVTMHAVATRAGVGQGTLYRHFPHREDLVLTVYELDVERLISAATTLAATHPPREAMRRWLAELAAYGQVKHGVSQIVLAAATREDIATTWRPRVLHAVQRLLDAGQEKHELRGDLDALDLWDLVAFLWLAPISPSRADRLISVVLDGLSAPPALAEPER